MNRRNNMKYTVFKMTFEKFNVTLQEKQEIKDALISHNLYKTSEKPSFIKICDTLEEAQEELCHWDSYWAHIVRRHIVGGTYRTLISVQNPLRLCRTGICRSLSAG